MPGVRSAADFGWLANIVYFYPQIYLQLMLCRFICLAAFAASIAGCSSSEGRIPSQQATCEIATDYVKRFVDEAERLRAEYADAPRGIAVREAPHQLLPVISEEGPVEGISPNAIAEVSDWRKITRLSGESVLGNCPGLRSWLSKRTVISDDEKINSLTTGNDWQAHVLSIAMPVFTADQEKAVVFARKGMGGLAGIEVLAIYSKGENGDWQFVREKVRSVS